MTEMEGNSFGQPRRENGGPCRGSDSPRCMEPDGAELALDATSQSSWCRALPAPPVLRWHGAMK